jgi:DDE superfamily endonuclease
LYLAAIATDQSWQQPYKVNNLTMPWQLALEMIDELIGWGRTPPVLTADAGYGDTTALRQGLTDREIGYVVAVKGATSAHPGGATPQAAPYAGGIVKLFENACGSVDVSGPCGGT